MSSPIYLPVIRRLRVHNFPLYPGPANQGIDLEFSDGVTVIAGINGIGKTTLLNLLLRMLLGASSPSKAATRDLGKVSKRKLVQSRKFSYFSERAAGDLGDKAVATLTFELANKTIEVTRLLKNLQIRKLVIARRKIAEPTNESFLDELAEMAGLASAYDFHIVVRYVQFFTEDRLPLLWSPSSQFELFKMLFVDHKMANQLNKLYADIQSVDSNYRNRTHAYNEREERLTKLLAGAATPSASAADVIERRQVQEQAELAWKKALAVNRDLVDRRKRLENERDEVQLALDQELRAFSHADATYIAQALPSLDDKLLFLLQGLGSSLGCFVCGKRGKRELSQISKKLRTHRCFVCDARFAEGSTNVVPITLANIKKIEQKIEMLRATVTKHSDALVQVDAEMEPAMNELRRATAARNDAAHQLQMVQAQVTQQIPGGEADWLALEKAELQALDKKRKDLTTQYKAGIAKVTTAMDDFQLAIGKGLTKYAEAFLHEKVKVSFTRSAPFKIATGTGQVNVPTFRISMTSSTHAAMRERGTATSVSESQKEFLDLAFRMTLLDVIAGTGATMLVMETPEASLDSWFMKRAADLIRKFAPAKDGQGRMLLATSNLNGTRMIPALLGLVDARGRVGKLEANDRHRLIDLMKIAASPGVLDLDDAKGMLVAELGAYANG